MDLQLADRGGDAGKSNAGRTTDMSRIADMVVISRDTAFTNRDKPVNTRQIGRDLNARYLLEGSGRRSAPFDLR